ncbi:MAG: hypothetical protein PHF84_02405 [bacterium]|nr:hypothetical protein [bacterium]
MKKNILYLFLLAGLMFILNNCGIQPPTQDLDLAKAKLAEAEEVEANQYAPTEFNKAKELINSGSKVMVKEKSRKNKGAKEDFTSAKTEAEKAYTKAAPSYTQKNIQELESSLSKGKEIKADVAAKDDYSKAQQLLTESKDAYAKKEYKNSYTKAKTAREIAENAYKSAAEKKSKAETAIQDAKKSLEEVEKNQNQ